MKKFLKYLLVTFLLLAVVAYAVPWKNLLEARLKNELAANGLEKLEFRLASVAPDLAVFSDISYGEFRLPVLSLHYNLKEIFWDKDKANIEIEGAKILWRDGVVSTGNIYVPLYSDAPIPVTLTVKQVELNTLLSALTGNRASATGVVSGTLPLIINRDGSFTLKKGNLKADKAGTLKLSPDVIPAEAAQVALLREALADFHYSDFSMVIESADSKKLSMLLSLQGNNPAVYNGRVIKLNVHLNADMLH